MSRLKYDDFLNQVKAQVTEVQPWDAEQIFDEGYQGLILDVREADEFAAAHLKNSILVPRGVLEAAADEGFEESEPKLIEAREKEVIVLCRSGRRSLLAAHVLQLMGFQNVKSLQQGARGLFDAGYPMYNQAEEAVSEEDLDKLFYPG